MANELRAAPTLNFSAPQAALRMAALKYGSKVGITGSSEFRERASRQAVRLGIEVMDADLQGVVKDEQARMQRKGPQLSPGHVGKTRHDAVKSLKPQDATALPEMRAVDAARTRTVQDWMHSLERIEQQGGDVAAANAHSRKALAGVMPDSWETSCRQRPPENGSAAGRNDRAAQVHRADRRCVSRGPKD